MKFIRKLFWSIAILVFLLLLLWGYFGGFKKLVAFEVVMGPHTVAYIEHVGDYKLIGTKMEELYEILKLQDIDTTMGIGIYYDDPMVVDKDVLRSDIGVVINKEDLIKLDFASNDYHIKDLAKTDYVVVTFPFKNKLSYMVGMYRAYPVLFKYLADNNYKTGGPSIEMYDRDHNLIYYMFEIK